MSQTTLTTDQSTALAEARALTEKSDLRGATKTVLRLLLLGGDSALNNPPREIESSEEWVDLMRTPLGEYIADSPEFDEVRAEVVAELEAAKI